MAVTSGRCGCCVLLLPLASSDEVVQLDEGQRLRIRHHGYYIADVRSVHEPER
jgi:hypothetical protein